MWLYYLGAESELKAAACRQSGLNAGPTRPVSEEQDNERLKKTHSKQHTMNGERDLMF